MATPDAAGVEWSPLSSISSSLLASPKHNRLLCFLNPPVLNHLTTQPLSDRPTDRAVQNPPTFSTGPCWRYSLLPEAETLCFRLARDACLGARACGEVRRRRRRAVAWWPMESRRGGSSAAAAEDAGGAMPSFGPTQHAMYVPAPHRLLHLLARSWFLFFPRSPVLLPFPRATVLVSLVRARASFDPSL